MTLCTLRRTALLFVLVATGCGHDFEPPDRAERVREAAATFDAAAFDSITWESDSIREFQGNEVYAEKCRRCHGPLGRGVTDYAKEQGLDVPSLVERDWPLASLDSLRRTVYVGHEEGMPVYGSGGIGIREIDAVASYVLYTLRPDVLDGGED